MANATRSAAASPIPPAVSRIVHQSRHRARRAIRRRTQRRVALARGVERLPQRLLSRPRRPVQRGRRGTLVPQEIPRQRLRRDLHAPVVQRARVVLANRPPSSPTRAPSRSSLDYPRSAPRVPSSTFPRVRATFPRVPFAALTRSRAVDASVRPPAPARASPSPSSRTVVGALVPLDAVVASPAALASHRIARVEGKFASLARSRFPARRVARVDVVGLIFAPSRVVIVRRAARRRRLAVARSTRCRDARDARRRRARGRRRHARAIADGRMRRDVKTSTSARVASRRRRVAR